MSGQGDGDPKAAPLEVVSFDYIKSPDWRVIHADGAYGGLTPRGLIHASIYSERHAIPQHVEQRIVDSQLGEETLRVSRGGIVRELEVGIIWDIESARSMRDWLAAKIVDLETAMKAVGGKK